MILVIRLFSSGHMCMHYYTVLHNRLKRSYCMITNKSNHINYVHALQTHSFLLCVVSLGTEIHNGIITYGTKLR